MSDCNGKNTRHICGKFDQPSNPDDGDCFPYRVKLSCEAPTIPAPECGDEIEVIFDPTDPLQPFTIWSTLFDENCSAITDENDSPIKTQFR